MKQYGHWEVKWDFDPNQFVGFIYCITHLPTGRSYIGKKFFKSTVRKIVKGRVNRKKVVKESDWKTYTGSSKWLNAEIQLYGKDQFKFEIISLHESKGSLAYAEVRMLVLADVLRKRLEDDSKAFFNGMIPSIKFNPPTETENEAKYKVDIFRA